MLAQARQHEARAGGRVVVLVDVKEAEVLCPGDLMMGKGSQIGNEDIELVLGKDFLFSWQKDEEKRKK